MENRPYETHSPMVGPGGESPSHAGSVSGKNLVTAEDSPERGTEN